MGGLFLQSVVTKLSGPKTTACLYRPLLIQGENLMFNGQLNQSGKKEEIQRQSWDFLQRPEPSERQDIDCLFIHVFVIKLSGFCVRKSPLWTEIYFAMSRELTEPRVPSSTVDIYYLASHAFTWDTSDEDSEAAIVSPVMDIADGNPVPRGRKIVILLSKQLPVNRKKKRKKEKREKVLLFCRWLAVLEHSRTVALLSLHRSPANISITGTSHWKCTRLTNQCGSSQVHARHHLSKPGYSCLCPRLPPCIAEAKRKKVVRKRRGSTKLSDARALYVALVDTLILSRAFKDSSLVKTRFVHR